MLFGKENLITSDEAPEEPVPEITPYSFWVVGHIYYIVGAREVGFGSEYAAITELTHSANAFEQKPVESIDEELHIPVVDLCGTELPQ